MTMDGMVFDLEAWLPQHPGGATIIPQQALNKVRMGQTICDACVEVGHADVSVHMAWRRTREHVRDAVGDERFDRFVACDG